MNRLPLPEDQTRAANLLLAALRRYAMSFGMAIIPLSCLRILLLRICGARVGKGCYLGFNVICDTNYTTLIRIGDHVTISHDTVIYAHTASPVESPLSKLYHQVRPVTVESGAWIGASCIVLPGVTIGRDCMVGAGSVVSKSTEPSSLYAGNPCRKIKTLQLNSPSDS
jgi:acetyltransferase-like isoleucine patch superfamily enzyme